MRQTRFAAALCAALLVVSVAPASAQQLGNRPVRMVLPYTTGGPTDLSARVLAEAMSPILGVPVIVENRPGAGGRLGTAHVAKAPADGYTVAMVSNTFVLGMASRTKQPYDALRDFAPITLATRAPFVLAVHPGLHVKSVHDLLALARSRAGGLNFASSGAGTGSHLAIELLKARTGIPVMHVPYRGSNPALLDLVEGRVDALFATPAAIMPIAEDRKLLALATTGRMRRASAPGVPTMIEGGVPDFEVVVWFALVAPAGTPPAVLRKFHADTVKALNAPGIAARLKAQGQEVVGMPPDELAVYLEGEVRTWGDIVRQADIRFD